MRQLVADVNSQSFKNLIAHALPWGSGAFAGWGSTAPTVVDVPAGQDGYQGRAYREYTATASGIPSQAGGGLAQYNASNFGVSSFAMSILTALNIPYSMVIPVRATIAQCVRCTAQGITPTAGGVQKHGANIVLTPNQWVLVPVLAWVATGTTLGLRVDLNLASSGYIAWSAGDKLAIGRPFVYQRDTLPEIPSDGRTPYWKWLGTADASESVGYPYTLESIVGRPLASIDGAGSIDVPELALGEPRTVFQVSDRLALLSTTRPHLQVAPLASFYIRSGTGSGPEYMSRLQNAAGSATFGIEPGGASAIGRHVLMGHVNQDFLSASFAVDAKVEIPISRPDAEIGTPSRLIASSFAGSEMPVKTMIYRGLNQETRTRARAWLARKYNTPIPSGY